jgi:DNA polymerase-4
MELKHNPEPPEIMHIDLNSAFAMTEQQANPLIRHKPVGVTNRLNDFAICITSSYEAKAKGIGIGTRRREAQALAPDFVMIESDPAKYQYVHRRMREIFESYSPTAYMKSVDEGIIDFTGMRQILKGRTLEDIALEIKQRFREEIGDYMTINIGIAQNRYLAKVAASFNKPNGLLAIDKNNILSIYAMLQLTDLPYIKQRMRLRLNMAGIYTPLDFYNASEPMLSKRVFRSINGHLWYLKLRGYETEVQFGIKTVGRSYVLEHRTNDPAEIKALLFKASAKLARRLKVNDLAARGLMMWLGYAKPRYGEYLPGWRSGWFKRQMYKTPVHRGDQVYERAVDLFNQSPKRLTVSSLQITAYELSPVKSDQLYLWDSLDAKLDRAESAMNSLNDRYGEQTIVPGKVLESKNPMKDKIPFGSIRYFQ